MNHTLFNQWDYYGVGEAPESFTVGDFVLTHQSAWTSRLIRFGQRIEFRGDRKKFAYWNHALWVTSVQGDIIEAVGKGVSKNNIVEYLNQEYVVIHTQLSPVNVGQSLAYVESMINDGYGFIEDISIGFQLLFDLKVMVTYGDTIICSALVARGLEHAGEILSMNPYMVKPADLAEMANIIPPHYDSPSIREIKKRFLYH